VAIDPRNHSATATATATATAARFVEYRRTGDRRTRNELVEQHRHTVEYFVGHYARRGVSEDDLRQVALLALIHAVERFDPVRGVGFGTFASRTIEGELKRYFRDRTWSVRPPRRAQELHLALRRADEEALQRLGRTPTIAELAAEVDASVDHVLEALEAGTAHRAASLDQPQGADDESGAIGDRLLGVGERGYVDIDQQLVVRQLLAGLPEREREIMRLRFFDNLSQPEIAARVGVSQSYLSRVIRRTLVDLRDRLTEDSAPD